MCEVYCGGGERGLARPGHGELIANNFEDLFFVALEAISQFPSSVEHHRVKRKFLVMSPFATGKLILHRFSDFIFSFWSKEGSHHHNISSPDGRPGVFSS